MATTQYPKSYVIERIKARRVSLERQIGEHEAILDKVYTAKYTELDVWLGNVDAHLDTVRKSLKAAHVAYDRVEASASPKDQHDAAFKAVKDLQTALTSWPGAPAPAALANSYTLQKFGHKAVEAVEMLPKLYKELDALEHTEAYLIGTPVEEFSLTSLKQLNLLSVIQFNLLEAKREGQK